MEKLNALMESEVMSTFYENNQEVITETAKATEEFAQKIFEYVTKNPDVFIESSLENVKKNIRIFTEVAICQFLTEITAINAKDAKIIEPPVPVTEENALNDYI
jgi:hypothetical protein